MSRTNRTSTFYAKTATAFEEWRNLVSQTQATSQSFYEAALELVDDSKQCLLNDDTDAFSTQLSAVMSLALRPEFPFSDYERRHFLAITMKVLMAADEMQAALTDEAGNFLRKPPVEPKPIRNTECKKVGADHQCVYKVGTSCTPKKGTGVPTCVPGTPA